MSNETELKFEVAPQDLRKLKAARTLNRGKPKQENLVSVYFDTPKHKLARHDVSLRVRHNSNKRLQTIKSRGRNGSITRGEWQHEIKCDIPHLRKAHGSPLKAPIGRAAGGAVRDRKVSDRLLYRKTGAGIGLWRGNVLRHAFDLGLLFCSNRSVRRGVHTRLRQAARASGRGAARARRDVSPAMALPLRSPFPPMEALSVDRIPFGKHWQYEPKWNCFRCIIFRDGKKVELHAEQ